jgi:hypothetical protein
MIFLNTKTKSRIIQAAGAAWACVLLMTPGPGWCADTAAQKATQAVEQSVTILRKSQQEKDSWEQEKTRLVLLYEQLQQEDETLLSENKDLTSKEASMKARNLNLALQKKESIRLAAELFPFLQDLYNRLEILVANDPPFLKQERATRLQTLEKTLNDPFVTIAEKYRKTMEAVFIEAEYGSTIEVYQDKIQIDQEEVLGNIFRLGRVSLFFLSLDQASCAYFSVSKNLWQPLPDDHLAAIRSAMEIGSKRRPAELLRLPLGKLAMEANQ